MTSKASGPALPVIRERRPTGLPPDAADRGRSTELGYRYPGASTDAVRSVSFELGRGQVMADRRRQRIGQDDAGQAGVRPAGADEGIDPVGRRRPGGCDPSLVRAQIAPVFQDFARYMVTIRRVIGLGDSDRIDDEAGDLGGGPAGRDGGRDRVAAERARHPAREGLPDGTDLSIGQWQRLAIARALFRDAPVVLLDEPSASLDPRAEAELFDLLQTLCDDRIVIFVSHRFATVRSADVVLVLDQGEVVEMGSHDELMAADGLYHDLFNLQADRYGFTP